MMALKKYLQISLLLLLINFGLVGCGALDNKEIVVQKEYVYSELELKERPEGVILYDVSFNVVTDDNLDSFLTKNRESEGDTIFIAISVSDYEKLSLNVGELKRYLMQQKSLLIYYEEIIQNNNNRKVVGK